MNWLGDRKRFAIGVEWESCPQLGDDGQRVTFARFAIVCEERDVTRHVSPLGLHDDVLIPASSVAIWLARSWPQLAGSERLFGASRFRDAHSLLCEIKDEEWDEHEDEIDTWLNTHALTRVRDGLLLPNVIFWRRGGEVVISWRADEDTRTERKIQFTGNGVATFPVRDVLEPLREFIDLVGQRILTADKASASREWLVAAREKLARPWWEQTELIAARLGRSVNSFFTWLEEHEEWKKAPGAWLGQFFGFDPNKVVLAEQLDSPVAVAARSAAPQFTDADLDHLHALGTALASMPPATKLKSLRKKLQAAAQGLPERNDPQTGYERAAAVRRVLKQPLGRLDVEELLRTLGCHLQSEAFDDPWTDGVALWNARGCAVVVANTSSPRVNDSWGKRAMLAHELYHLLFDTVDHHFFGECTSDWTPTLSERKANAFAAELLLPVGALTVNMSEAWTHPDSLTEAVKRLCKEYEVGWELTVRQLQNRKKLQTPLVDRLLGSLGR